MARRRGKGGKLGLAMVAWGVWALGVQGEALADGAMKLASETCAACHGADGNSVAPEFPNLAGQQKTYLLREMLDYKEGRRQNDIMSPLMAGVSEADMTALADWYAKQAPAPLQAVQPGRLALGKRIYLEGNDKSGVPSCDGCHEENGEGSKKFPRVAGQHVAYTLDQIAQYASGKRSNGVKVMRTIAQRLTKEEAEAVAEYMASLK
jgi:cytochrome c553